MALISMLRGSFVSISSAPNIYPQYIPQSEAKKRE